MEYRRVPRRRSLEVPTRGLDPRPLPARVERGGGGGGGWSSAARGGPGAASLEEYIRDPAPTPSLSTSIAHLLLTRSAKHAQLAHPRLNPAWQPDATEQTDVGSIAHALLLDRDESRVVVIDASDWRTRAAKDQRDAARAEGKLPILTDRYGEVVHMVLAARQAIADAPEIAAAFAGGRPRQTLLWPEQGTGGR